MMEKFASTAHTFALEAKKGGLPVAVAYKLLDGTRRSLGLPESAERPCGPRDSC